VTVQLIETVPVGGKLRFLTASSVRPTGLSLDAFMSIYGSMGATRPQFLNVQANSTSAR